MGGNFLISWEPVSFSRRTLLHGVSITFRDMPLLLFDYTIQGVGSSHNIQLNFIMDKTTRTAIGAEEMLLHVIIGSADVVIGFDLSIGTLARSLHWLECWKWLPGVLKLLPSDYCLHTAIYIMRLLTAWFDAVYKFLPHKHTCFVSFR